MSKWEAEDRRVIDLFEAGDEAVIVTALDEDLSLGRVDVSGRTLLHLAGLHGLSSVARELTLRGANPECRDFHDRTPLMLAAEKGHEATAQVLLTAGASAGTQNVWGRTALMYAANRLNPPVMEKLLGAGASPHAVDRTGRSALDYASLRRGAPKISECSELLTRAMKAAPSDHERPAPVVTRGKSWLSGRPQDELAWTGPGAALGCMFLSGMVGLLGLFTGSVFWVEGMRGAVAIGIWISLVIPSFVLLLRKSQLPPGPDAPPGVRVATPQTEPQSASPAYVSSMLHLGSAALAAVHHNTPYQLEPEFHGRMRVTRVLGITTGLVATGVLLALPGWVGTEPWVLGGASLLTAAGMFAFEQPNRLRRRRLLQAEEDRRADGISKQLSQELPDPSVHSAEFGLYLRSFQTTNRLKVLGVDLETQIAYSISSVVPIVALGQPGEHIGAGRIETSEGEWKEEVLRLMHGARVILLIPSDRAGTMWEIDQLRVGGYLDRTIFIMPPELRMGGKRFSVEWNRAMTALVDRGFEIPPHFAKGLFFRVDTEGHFIDHAPFIMDEFLEDADRREGGDDGFDGSPNLGEEPDVLDVAVAVVAGVMASLDQDTDGPDGDFDGGFGDGGE